MPIPNVENSLDEVKRWIKSMGERGMYQPTSARLRMTALERMVSVLGPEEDKTPQAVLRGERRCRPQDGA